MLTIFANFRIDSTERLENMKRSFFSFHNAKIKNWVLNIRGDKKNEAKEFLEKNITQNFKIFMLKLFILLYILLERRSCKCKYN